MPKPALVSLLLAVALLVPACATAKSSESRKPSFDEETRIVFGLQVTEKRLSSERDSVFMDVGVALPVSPERGFRLLSWARHEYPRSRQIRLSIHWMNSTVARTIYSFDWTRGSGSSAEAVRYTSRLDTASTSTGPGHYEWVSGTRVISDAPTSAGSLDLHAWVDPNINGGGEWGMPPQVRVVPASDTWVDAVASSKAKAPRFAAPFTPAE